MIRRLPSGPGGAGSRRHLGHEAMGPWGYGGGMSGPAIGLWLQAFAPADVGVFCLSEDEEIPAEDEDYSASSRSPVQGLIVGAGRSGSVNHLLLGHLTVALARRLDALTGPLQKRPADHLTWERTRLLVSAPRACAEFAVCGGNTPCPTCPPSHTVRRHRPEARAYTGRTRSAFRCIERSRKPVGRTAPACPPTGPSPPPSPCTVTAG
ncbi:DUF6368 family protein [Streptomyces sp. CBMAI 2042]|uniref:DUF6368 family protein n=1 Tax=Streptomyces sp. CBMAI 2042 TaxID=2305222 RepID=UPI003FA756BC